MSTALSNDTIASLHTARRNTKLKGNWSERDIKPISQIRNTIELEVGGKRAQQVSGTLNFTRRRQSGHGQPLVTTLTLPHRHSTLLPRPTLSEVFPRHIRSLRRFFAPARRNPFSEASLFTTAKEANLGPKLRCGLELVNDFNFRCRYCLRF